MDTYSVVIDSEMIRNMLQTNLGESLDLFTLKLVLYVLFLGILPIFFIYKSQIVYKPLKSELFSKLKTIILSIILISIILFSFSKFYTSFFREHKPLRYNINPINDSKIFFCPITNFDISEEKEKGNKILVIKLFEIGFKFSDV